MKLFTITACSLLLLGSGIIATAQSKSSLKTKQNSLSKALNNVKSKKAKVQSQLRQKSAETQKMMDDIHRVDARMATLEKRIDDSTAQLAEDKAKQAQLAADLRSQTAKLDEVRVQISKRVRSIYARGESTPVSLLLKTSSLSDLAARKALVERIAEKDRQLFSDARVLRDMILAQKKEQDRIVAKIADLITQNEADLKELTATRLEKKDIFSILKAQEDKLEDQLDQMNKESRRLESEIFAIQAKSQGSVPIFKGKFIKPVSGRMSSKFGYRIHPISKRRKMHNGVDWAAPTGTSIRAAGSGKVITAAYLRGYGNTVIIDHGGKISTLYGHCSRLNVKKGAYVKQGQVIAKVGSTGYSTGPHLHFEVRVNGKPVNPLSRL